VRLRAQVGGLCTNFFGGTADYTWMVDNLNICETAAKYKYRAQDGVEYNLKDIHFHTPSVRGRWCSTQRQLCLAKLTVAQQP
jgi:hypothetical protein